MSTQIRLFDFGKRRYRHHGAARKTDPQTSKDAAESINATELEMIWLDAIAKWGKLPEYFPGLTTNEGCALTGLTQNSLTPRTAPLQRRGLIKDSGLRRAGESGRKSIVWMLAGPKWHLKPGKKPRKKKTAETPA